MRDPRRIDVIINKLRDAWKMHPDLRLGQLMCIIEGGNDMFGTEDNVTLERIEKFMEDFK